MKTGYYGFSWTTLFFGCFPALFRGDFLTFIGIFVVLFLIGIATFGIGTFVAMFVWAFFYNGYYTRKLLEKGYALSDFQHVNEEAARKLGVSIPAEIENSKDAQITKPSSTAASSSTFASFKQEDKTLTNDAYKIYLVKKYPLEFNDVLKKYIFKDKLFDSVEDALIAVHKAEVDSEELFASQNARTKASYRDKDEAISFLGLRGINVHESSDGKITVTDKNSTKYFYHAADFLEYANNLPARG